VPLVVPWATILRRQSDVVKRVHTTQARKRKEDKHADHTTRLNFPENA